MEGNITSATIGMLNSTGLDGLQIVFNGDYIQDELSLQFRKQLGTNWFSLYSETNNLSGILEVGEPAEFSVDVNSEGLPENFQQRRTGCRYTCLFGCRFRGRNDA